MLQVTQLNAHSEDKESLKNVHVCVRLSVLTGATWIISLVAETLGVDWLQFFSILANGGQGVLIFLSYVTTRRVAAMLAARLGLRDKSRASHATSHTVHSTSRSKSKFFDAHISFHFHKRAIFHVNMEESVT